MNTHQKKPRKALLDTLDEALRERELMYHTLFDNALNPIMIADDAGRYLDANQAALNFLECSRQELLTRQVWDFAPPGQLPTQRAQHAPFMRRRTLETDYWINGTVKTLVLNVVPLTVAGKTLLYGIGQDVTAQKQMKKTLTEEKQRAQQYLQLAGVMFIALDAEGTITLANQKACDLLGWSEHEMLGRNWFEQCIPQRIRHEVFDVFRRLISGDLAPVEYHENAVVTREGRERLIAWHNAYLQNTAGEMTGIIGSGEDITERRQAEEALRLSQQHYRSYIDHAPDGIFVADQHGKYHDVNNAACQITGYSREELLSLRILDLIAPDAQDIARQHFLQAVTTGRATGELAFLRKEGTRRFWSVDAVKLSDDRVLGFAKDITDRKEAEDEVRRLNVELEERVRQRTAELEAANHELTEFASIVSHDLKAPLRGIHQISKWLVEDYAKVIDDTGKELATLLIGRVKRMDNLIDGILRYSRAGRIIGDDVRIDLAAFLRELIEMLAPPPTIRIRIDLGCPEIVGDAMRLQQVFQNVLHNAIKFMENPDGDIVIGNRDDRTRVACSGRDTGPGIDKKYQEKIFQMFQTLHPCDEHESTGIGLALVKKIVEFLGRNDLG